MTMADRKGPKSDEAAWQGGRRILLDCTQTIATPRSAGIPRVVRNIARHAAAAARHQAVLVPVWFDQDRFFSLGLTSAGDIVAPLQPQPVQLHPLLVRLRKLLVPRTIVRAVRREWRKLRWRIGWPPPGEVIEFGPDDTLLLADSSWGIDYWSVVDAARAKGTRLGVVQYDFIPHTHPELVPKKLPTTFRFWMRNALERADFVAAISESVAVEARDELRRANRDPEGNRPLVRSFRLGADVKPQAKADPPRAELAAFVEAADAGPYLTVGTIEPRKNQTILLDAFERIWKDAPDARLLVAGFVGWRGDEVVDRLRSHPRYGTHLLHFGDLSDAELLYAYRHARALVFPSRAEGYGLPIVEALAHRMRVFASDIPPHREVGQSHCVYFPPQDPAALAEQVVRFERDGVFAADRAEGDFSPPTWRRAIEQLMEIAFAAEPKAVGQSRPDRVAA
jgi:glycosyltransferase involved in cell wall biosynthesis